MFNFINEISLGKEVSGYKYVNLSGEKIFVQGFLSLLCFDDIKIVLKLKDGELEISGENLNIEELSTNSILVSGKIKSVKVD